MLRYAAVAFLSCSVIACTGDDFGVALPTDDAAAPTPDVPSSPETDATVAADVTTADGSGEAPRCGDDLPPISEAACDSIAPLERAYPLAHCPYDMDHTALLQSIYPSCDSGSPATAPEQIHLTFPHVDASSTVAVTWQTGADNRWSLVRVGDTPDTLDRTFEGHTFTYQSLGGRLLHEVHLCGLPAGQTFYYQVGGGGTWSETYAFTTAPELGSDDEFVFAVAGDTRSDDYALWSQATQQMAEAGAQFVVFSGDAVEAGPAQSQWDGFFAAAENVLTSAPFLPANGNHDLLVVEYLGQFALPEGEDVFHVRYGNALFISMTHVTFEPGAFRGRYRDYLEDTLAANQDAEWVFLVNHRPFYSASTRHGSAEDLQDEWMPLLDEYGVDMVFNGHDHNYERSVPVRNNAQVALGEGTIYVVSAGLGAPMYDNGAQWWTHKSEKIPSWCLIRVSGSRVEFTAYRLDGTVLDEFVWDKSN